MAPRRRSCCGPSGEPCRWGGRGEVDQVESERAELGEPTFGVSERSVPSGLGRLRTWKHLVPGAHFSHFAVHVQFEDLAAHRICGRDRTVGCTEKRLVELDLGAGFDRQQREGLFRDSSWQPSIGA